ncbi:hypothetical protein MNBD_GAMMA08-888 [hydrothermal vent metagenome]|uniref:Uncharacterized protein n=1 Tax=hydrothermal vent metagenome TaxID=652676 RepID=A0A3B0XBT7_9ZZZZ
MGGLLSEPENITSINSALSALNKNWYAGITVSGKGLAADKTINNCREYFDASKQGLKPVKEFERSAYYEFAIMCVAAKSITSAVPASISFLRDFVLNKESLKKLPKAFSFKTSEAEYKKILDNKELISWHDVGFISEVKDIKPDSAVFKSEGAQQKISFIAKADFNRDGIEDLLISSKDSVIGGSYLSIRMFLITRLGLGEEFILLKAY